VSIMNMKLTQSRSLSAMRKALYAITPIPVVKLARRLKRANEFRENRSMTTEEVFTDVYRRGRWGKAEGEFSSGSGSYDNEIVRQYVAALRLWLEGINSRRLACVDLGCGDFNVGKQLTDLCGSYTGVDIVRPLVEHHQANFSSDRVAFKQLNIADDPLPAGDICFLRQVLQHLSNRQIAAVLAKLGQYNWAIITEHQPSAGRSYTPNLDMPHSHSTRVIDGSGVFIDEPPFSFPQHRMQLLCEVIIPASGFSPGIDPGVIRTFAVDLRGARYGEDKA
jgi:hypothetical protein